MRINHVPEGNLFLFSGIEQGYVFEYSGILYMKIERDNSDVNAVSLEYGYTHVFKDNDQVHLYREAIVHLGSPAEK